MTKFSRRKQVSQEDMYESPPPSSSVSIVELPEDLIRDHICPLLKVKMIARIALCSKFLYKCVTEDSVWHGAWMKISMNKQQHKIPPKRFNRVLVTTSVKLYTVVCMYRNSCLVKKWEEQWKHRQQQISMRGPLYTLRRFVLREMQSRQFGVLNTRYSMLGKNTLDYGRINNEEFSSSSKISSISIPLKIVTTVQKERFCEKVRGSRHV